MHYFQITSQTQSLLITFTAIALAYSASISHLVNLVFLLPNWILSILHIHKELIGLLQMFPYYSYKE